MIEKVEFIGNDNQHCSPECKNINYAKPGSCNLRGLMFDKLSMAYDGSFTIYHRTKYCFKTLGRRNENQKAD